MFSLSPLIPNVKGAIRGGSPGVSGQHLPGYLAEFCCRCNGRVLKSPRLNRMITAGLIAFAKVLSSYPLSSGKRVSVRGEEKTFGNEYKAQTVTFPELRGGAQNEK